MIEIRITQRSSDWHACISGHPEIWGCGRDPLEAIGDLVMAHTQAFDATVFFPKPEPKVSPEPDNPYLRTSSDGKTYLGEAY